MTDQELIETAPDPGGRIMLAWRFMLVSPRLIRLGMRLVLWGYDDMSIGEALMNPMFRSDAMDLARRMFPGWTDEQILAAHRLVMEGKI